MTITIHSLSHDGRGVGVDEQGKTHFVFGALPGETVTFKILKKHSRYNDCMVEDILEPSAERVVPHCPHFYICGGCSLQHMSMALQLQHKQTMLLEQLKHFGDVQAKEILPPTVGQDWHYRRKARLGVRFVRKKERLLIGFREKASRYLADIKTCPILDKRIGTILPEIAAAISALSIYEHIPQIEVAVSDNSAALVFRHMENLSESDLEALKKLGQEQALEIYLQPNPPAAITKLYPDNHHERLEYSLADYDLKLEFFPLDFTQINGEVNPKMIRLALSLLDIQPEETVLDLFCGLGNFTLPMARYAKHVTGVEGSHEMVTRGYENASKNKIENVTFIAADLASEDKTLQAWEEQTYDKILLDPPRTGAKEIIAKFSRFNAKKIVYVSCNPATLARDAGILVNEQGYKLSKIGIINMFPHTTHVEAIALFE